MDRMERESVFSLKYIFNLFLVGFRFVFYLSIILSILGTGIVIGVVKTFSKQLPEIGYHSYEPSVNSYMYDSNGKLMTELYSSENRKEIVPISRIPLRMQQAIISIEDSRFYKHYGIDPIRIVAAFIKNLRTGRISQGASTITQQLARNAFLSPKKTYVRKIKEVLLAFKIEKKFTKKEILELYLNQIFFGNGSYGIASAARNYFDKRVEDLTLPECAILASLPKSPRNYNPYTHPKKSKQRQILVLNMMKENGYITEEEARKAKLAPIVLASGRRRSSKSSYFIEYVKSQLLKMFDYKTVYTKGIKVYTTYDPKIQKAAEEAFKNAPIFKKHPLSVDPTLQGGLLAIDPKNGYIKAMVGGRDFKQSEFNRCTMAKRQPGSSFKPFVYLTGIESGMKANDLFIDEPLEIVNRYTHKVWKPRNYGNAYVGPVIMKRALMKSLNTIAVRIAQSVGPRKIINYAKRMGISSYLGPHLSLSLGAVDVTLMDMVTGYATIANEGIRVKPIAITKVLDRDGNILYEAKITREKVVDPTSVYILIDMMKGVINHGTGVRARLNRPCAGKTGTTNNYVDAWFCGFTPDLVACVYVGHDDRQPLGRRMTGGSVAAPIWKLFMKEALKDVPPSKFKVPEGIISKRVCEESGLLPSEFCNKTLRVALKAGTEPDEYCSSHMITQSADNFFQSDGTYIIRPHEVQTFGGATIETTLQFTNNVKNEKPPMEEKKKNKKKIRKLTKKRPKVKQKFHVRSRFQNHHQSPF
jgi:penicillin-binding protein 1A